MDGLAEFGSVNDIADNVGYVIKKMEGFLRLCTLIVRSLFDTTAAAAVDVDAPAATATAVVVVVVVVVVDDDVGEEREEAKVHRTASHSRMAVLASLTNSNGCLRLVG